MGDRQYRKEKRGGTGLLVESGNCRLPTIQAITRGDVRHVIHFSGYRVCPQANPGDTGRHSHRGPGNRRCLHRCPTCLRVAGGSTRQHGLASGKITVTLPLTPLPSMLLFPALPADKRWQTYRTTDVAMSYAMELGWRGPLKTSIAAGSAADTCRRVCTLSLAVSYRRGERGRKGGRWPVARGGRGQAYVMCGWCHKQAAHGEGTTQV